ncbi:hypothetical protein GDO81_018677, partial [Engystomops pustulosus]
MSSCLTEEQKRRIEENRLKALARRAERLAAQKNGITQNALPNAKPQPSTGTHLHNAPTSNAPKYVPPNTAKTNANVSDNTQVLRGPPTAAQEYTAGNKPQTAPAMVDYATKNPIETATRKGQLDLTKNFLQDASRPAGTSHLTHDVPPGPGTETVKSASSVSKFYGSGTTSNSTKTAAPAPRTEVRETMSSAGSSDRAPAKKAAPAIKGRCIKHGEGRFQVEVGYNAELISLFKGIPSKSYDPATKIWNFGLEDYPSLMSEVQRLQNVTLKPLEGMEDIDIPALLSTASGGTTVSALLALCNNWNRPNATLKGKCLLISRSRFEVDIGYHMEVIGLFKQMSSRNY